MPSKNPEITKKWREANKDKIKAYQKLAYQKRKESADYQDFIKTSYKESQDNFKRKNENYFKDYYKKNRDKILSRKKTYEKTRKKSDLEKLGLNIRSLISNSF